MGHQQNARPLPLPLPQEAHQLPLGRIVHPSCWLVQEQKPGAGDRHRAQRHPLPLTDAQVAGIRRGHFSKMQAIQQFVGIDGRGIAEAEVPQGHLQLLEDRVGEQEVIRVLGKVANAPAQIGRVPPSDRFPLKQDPALVWVQQADDASEQRGFAGTIGPHQGNQFASSHRQAHAAQDPVGPIAEGEPLDLKHGFTESASTCSVPGGRRFRVWT